MIYHATMLRILYVNVVYCNTLATPGLTVITADSPVGS
jgi:hypothetical protein